MDNAAIASRFESFMATFLAKTLRSTMTKGPLSEGPTAMFADVFDEEIGAAIARSGGLSGIADHLVHQLPGGRPTAPVAPEAAPAHLTSAFGDRVDPIDGHHHKHHGVDLGAPLGTPIHAGAAGRVLFAGQKGGYGNLVVVDHGDGTRTRYAHCRSIGVEVGQEVQAGEAIAEVGNTGRSTGPHLHFELRQGDDAVDPTGWLAEHTFPLAR